MVVRREKKTRKLRGHRTMGWGTKGQHRDRGAEGGRQIGMHKHKWSWVVKYGKNWYGKHGFVNPTTKRVSSISLRTLEQLLQNGKIKVEEKDNKKFVDLTKYGYDKLLGSGSISIPLNIIVKSCSEKAKEKVTKLGGEVILTPNA
ncbi:50S ribosomal protein L15 [Acidianus sulfidivorans JP7]|uniref:Large ribosomal subunit protein uL15 n=1 Tax=Acidianus sulfidivorans JP7 TaxID=619593 RepID=A0A2U9IMQ2_9CREN|nr:uL15 family ribosomal protein [Acidianus sulfidivorans]AWR97302.1 50S ribosomal protein L15 [Acidianus sulfidivorans JP7]